MNKAITKNKVITKNSNVMKNDDEEQSLLLIDYNGPTVGRRGLSKIIYEFDEERNLVAIHESTKDARETNNLSIDKFLKLLCLESDLPEAERHKGHFKPMGWDKGRFSCSFHKYDDSKDEKHQFTLLKMKVSKKTHWTKKSLDKKNIFYLSRNWDEDFNLLVEGNLAVKRRANGTIKTVEEFKNAKRHPNYKLQSIFNLLFSIDEEQFIKNRHQIKEQVEQELLAKKVHLTDYQYKLILLYDELHEFDNRFLNIDLSKKPRVLKEKKNNFSIPKNKQSISCYQKWFEREYVYFQYEMAGKLKLRNELEEEERTSKRVEKLANGDYAFNFHNSKSNIDQRKYNKRKEELSKETLLDEFEIRGLKMDPKLSPLKLEEILVLHDFKKKFSGS